MKEQVYIKPNVKVLEPNLKLLQIPVSPGYDDPDKPIEGKSNNLFEEDNQQNMWGRAWGRKDD